MIACGPYPADRPEIQTELQVDVDIELAAMESIAIAFVKLDARTARRVLSWVNQRYGGTP